MSRWELIHLLARVDGNDKAEDAPLLDHLYGGFADAILERWRS